MENLQEPVADPALAPAVDSKFEGTAYALTACGAAIDKINDKGMRARVIAALAILVDVREEVADILNS
jgi:hypothetical protein